MADADSPEVQSKAARPAFSTEPITAPAKPSVPLHAWALVSAAVGITIGNALVNYTTACKTPGADWPVICLSQGVFALPFAMAALFGAGMWLCLPSSGSDMRAVRWAGIGAMVAGAGVLAVTLAAFRGLGSLQMTVLPLMAAAPASMLLAARPDARLSAPGRKSPPNWIRAGALPSFALFLGVAVGMGLQFAFWMLLLDPVVWLAFGSPLTASALLLIAGALILRAARPAPEDGPEAGARRAPRWHRLTPMQRYAFLAEVAVVGSMAGCAMVFFTTPWNYPAYLEAPSALLMGGFLGAFAYALLAPALDSRQGRGRLIASAPLTAGIAPLLMLAASNGAGLAFVLGAAALFAFALASAPQRYAIAFDLSPSKGRLRAAMDFQAAKLAAAAGFPTLVVLADSMVPQLGLVLLSALGLFAFAVFGATLGGLGRRTL